MKIIKADNYQTWYLEHLDSAVLIDPWLTNTLQPEGTFFIQRRKKNPTCLSENHINKVPETLDETIWSDIKDKINAKEKNKIVRDFELYKKKELDEVFKKITPIIEEYMNNNDINIILDTKYIFMGKINSNLTESILIEINNSNN